MGNRQVNIRATVLTYDTDASGLMDFESKNFASDTVVIKPQQKAGVLYLVKNGIKLDTIADAERVEPYLERHPDALVVARFTWSDKGCFLCSPDCSRSITALGECYNVVSKRLNRLVLGRRAAAKRIARTIKEGDRIKMGRCTLVVRYLALKPVNSLTYLHTLMSQDTVAPVEAEALLEDVPQAEADAECDCDMVVREIGDRVAEKYAGSTASTHDRAEDSHRSALDEATPVSDLSPAAGEQDAGEGICRICLEGEEAGPLVVPCKCKGSMMFVHLHCIRTWVQGRLKVTDEEGNPQLSYFLQRLRCELCDVPYPSYVDVGSVVTEFLGIEEPAPPYMVLEPENTPATGLHLISLARKSVEIGRGGSADVVLQDISVSRLHAQLHYHDGEFVVEDQRSKFGTMVQMGSDFRIPVGTDVPITLKIGCDVLCVSATPARSLAALCCGSRSSDAVRIAF